MRSVFTSRRRKRLAVLVALWAAVQLVTLAITGHDDLIGAIYFGFVAIGTIELALTWADRSNRDAQ